MINGVLLLRTSVLRGRSFHPVVVVPCGPCVHNSLLLFHLPLAELKPQLLSKHLNDFSSTFISQGRANISSVMAS